MKSDNELIADFMGLKFYKDHETPWGIVTPELVEVRGTDTTETPKWDESWDSLMDVVVKCKALQRGKSLDISRSMYLRIAEPLGDCDMDGAYKAVVEFIKWYNENKKS